MNRPKKPKPLFGLFRKNKPEPVLVPSSSTSVPLQSILPSHYIEPRLPKGNPLLSPQFNQQRQYQTRPRSKSVGRDPSAHNKLMEERESALNKLCSREITSPTSSLADSLPLLSPTYTNAPPVPPIPLCHQQQPMRKFSSAHDLRKAAKLQQDSLNQAQFQPLPPKKKDLSRSRSLSNGQKLHSFKSQQQLSPTISRPRWPRHQQDDDDIPLGYLQSPISKPSSLLSDKEEEDDKDLVPIAILNTDSLAIDVDYQTAADKYKEKVKQKLQFDDSDSDDDDDIPISLLSINKNLYVY